MASPVQLINSPWCGGEVDQGKHLKVETQQYGRGRALLFRGDPLGQCAFSEAQASGEGKPVVVVDQEIYHRPPALLIATVDKFAQLPWRGETQMLFGQVNRWCSRHGFLSPSIEHHPGSHPARPGFAATKVTDHGPLRPPDLIIQATSRIGRRHPGLVCTVYNLARPRDLSHYERFAHYHATFYQHVEALSVTPFASGTLERGLAGVVVALIRLLTDEYNANPRAQDLDKSRPIVQEAIEAIVRRVEEIEGKSLATTVRKEINVKLDNWLKQAQGQGYQLGYQASHDGTARALLRNPGEGKWQPFTTLHSLRDVEPRARRCTVRPATRAPFRPRRLASGATNTWTVACWSPPRVVAWWRISRIDTYPDQTTNRPDDEAAGPW